MSKKCILLRHGLHLAQKRSSINTAVCCYNATGVKYNSDIIDLKNCNRCVEEESNGLISYRQGYNEKYSEYFDSEGIIMLDVTPNLNCNLTCKICNERASSSWSKLKQISIDNGRNLTVKKFYNILNEYDLSNLKEINFSGGEPFLNNNIVKYLNPLSEKIDMSKVELRFSNNGSVKLTKNISNLLAKFKLVLARFSLDDVGHGHEYHRFPGKWDEWEKNWQYFLDEMPVNVMPSINRTIGMLNINRLEFLEEWHSNFKFTRLGDPIELINHFARGESSLDNITQDVKNHILKKYGENSNTWNYIKNRTPSENSKITDFIVQMDAYHNQSFKEYDPELYKILFK
jgi:Radical SAM superfamily/4Fe-4S single cluster domain